MEFSNFSETLSFSISYLAYSGHETCNIKKSQFQKENKFLIVLGLGPQPCSLPSSKKLRYTSTGTNFDPQNGEGWTYGGGRTYGGRGDRHMRPAQI